MSEQLTKSGLYPVKEFFQQDKIKSSFEKLMGTRAQGFVTSILQITSTGDLATADPVSVYNAAITAAVLDLPINQNLGYAYIIAYNSKQPDGRYKIMAQFQMGYKGFKQLGIRTGQFKYMNATDVKEGEIKFFDRLSGSIEFEWNQDYDKRNSLKTIGYVSSFELLNGFRSIFYMSIPELENHARRYSKTYKKGYGNWKDDFESMALKTVTKLNLSKNAPLSIEMQRAVVSDQGIITNPDTNEVIYPDNEFVEAVEVDKELERCKLLISSAKSLKDLEKNEQIILQAYPELFTEFETKRTELSK